MITKNNIREILKECYLSDAFAKADYTYKSKNIFIKIYGSFPYVHHLSSSSKKNENELLEEGESIGLYPTYNVDSIQTKKNTIYDVNMEATRQRFEKIDTIFEAENHLFFDTFVFDNCNCIIYSIDEEIPQLMKDNIVYNTKEHKIKYVYKTHYGYETKDLKINNQIKNLFDNYNDTLPHQSLTDFINGGDSGISILYGAPGTGKTSYIRYLIDQNPNRDFYWLDQSAFYEMNNADFIEFLCDIKDSVVILEDCECILKSREETPNTVLSSILNLSDGMLGDSLCLKFICTFNTDLQSLDKALLRKGRLKMQYEFENLSKDKVAKLFEKLGIEETPTEMAICDVYNIDTNNGIKKETKKIGF